MSFDGAERLRPRLSAQVPPFRPPQADPVQLGRAWTCTYCRGLRFGLNCEGCGAPRAEAAAGHAPPPLRDDDGWVRK